MCKADLSDAKLDKANLRRADLSRAKPNVISPDLPNLPGKIKRITG
jgi:uncharacterized protein YjbI with pentapeptide repeats